MRANPATTTYLDPARWWETPDGETAGTVVEEKGEYFLKTDEGERVPVGADLLLHSVDCS